ncbi:hypothetical protein CLU95_4864 [Variovorax sp. 54]|nr:hypothetical protein [Variovorax sp. 54]PIF77687.1 hypothetical protein CLU95_4864 [Variovorax sp. 54]
MLQHALQRVVREAGFSANAFVFSQAWPTTQVPRGRPALTIGV